MLPFRLVSAALVLALLLQFAAPLHSVYAEEPPTGPTPAAADDVQPLPPMPPKHGSPKFDGQVGATISAYEQGGAVAAAATVGSSPTPLVDADNLRLVLEIDVAETAAIEAAVQAAGGTVESRYDDLLQVVVPFTALKRIEQLAGVRFIRFPHVPQPEVLSEGVARTSASLWHNEGLTGAGVKVAIVDLGFTGYPALLGSELPASVTVQCFCSSGDINGFGEKHGTGVAEIVHDMAPGAQLYLVRVDTDVNLANAVNYLVGQGVKVVNHSVSWYNTGRGIGDGPINAAVATARAGGILWVNSSGNQARNYWEGTWNGPNADLTYNVFFNGDQTNNVIIPSGSCIRVYLSWNNWVFSNQDYDLLLWDSSRTNLVAASTGAQTGTQPPTEELTYCATTTATYHLAIGRWSATFAAKFRLFVLGISPEYVTEAGSLGAPADSPNALTVGAVAHDQDFIEVFSSRGPTQDGRTKPDMVGPDRVSTVTYGTGAFTGTSSAAPHIAGAAAIVSSAYPALTPTQVQGYLENNGSGIDSNEVAGFGMVSFTPRSGVLDPFFGNGGIVRTDIVNQTEEAFAAVLQPDGKIVAGGYTATASGSRDFALVRFTASGAHDPSFGTGGKVTTDFSDGYDSINAVALQADGKIVAAGESSGKFALARFTVSGALDPSFGTGGKVTTDYWMQADFIKAVAVQPDGKIVAVGQFFGSSPFQSNFTVVRYTVSGALDGSFGSAGKVMIDWGGYSTARALVLQSDGKIVVVGSVSQSTNNGSDLIIARLTEFGMFDPAFGSAGKVITHFGSHEGGNAVVLQPDGKIVIAGWAWTSAATRYDFLLARYTTSGVLDTGFGTGGKVTTHISSHSGSHDFAYDDHAYALAIQPDGKLFVTGYTDTGTKYALARYSSRGILDPTFGIGGKITTDFGGADLAYALALQPDGKLLVVGSYRGARLQGFAVARYLVTNSAASLQFSAPTFSVAENGGNATITVTRIDGSVGAVGVTAGTIIGGTATGSADYTPKTETLSWIDGDVTSRTFTVPITNDAVYEGNETIRLALTNPTGGATLGLEHTATLTIVEDEIAGTLQFSAATYSVAENGGSATITVTRTGGGIMSVTAATKVAGSTATSVTDYTATSVTLAWTNGDTGSKTFTVSIVNDTLLEPDETVALVLSNPTGGAVLGTVATATLTITSDDAAVLGAYGNAIAADSPRAHWQLSETSGTLAADSSGNFNHGAYLQGVTLNAPGALPAEPSNNAALFDGTNDEVFVLDSASLSPTAAVSVEAWVKLSAYTSFYSFYPRLVSKSESYELIQYSYAGGEGRLEWKVTLTGGTVAVTTTYANRLLLGQWYHVVATYDGANLRIFINGVQKAMKPATGTVKDTSTPLYISSRQHPLAATLDEVAVYGTALSAARVLAHYEVVHPPVPDTPYAAGVMSDSPSAYWRLNETTGTTAADSVGSNHASYQHSPALGVAHALPDDDGNTAVTLDGVNDVIAAPDSASLSPTAAVSVEAWVKLTSYAGSYPRILSKDGSYELTLYTAPGTEGRLEWKVTLAGGAVGVTTAYADRLLLGQWYHVVATYDGANLRMYINGVQKAIKAATGAVKDVGSAFTISRSDRPLAATVDEVAVYGAALALARVQAHYALGAPPALQCAAVVQADAPAGCWRLNETSGTTAADLSGHGNTGTYTNGVVQGVAGALTTTPDAAAQFDGVNDFVRVNDSASLSPTSAVSVEAWVNLTSYAGSYPRLVSKDGAYELTLYTAAGHEGRLEWKVSMASGSVVAVTTAFADRLLVGQWYHVVATYDGSNLRVYLNGVQKAVKAATGVVKDLSSAFTISRGDRAVAAKLDEVAVYGTALSLARVQAHYAAR